MGSIRSQKSANSIVSYDEEQRKAEEHIVSELRPEVNFHSQMRLSDIIQDESKKNAFTPELDDRIRKYLERKYGRQVKAATFATLWELVTDKYDKLRPTKSL
mmetsp:Transcript_24278/g.37446  ORF Transcript_24278/g.37446 Transcript_24278/m.37446 type:complete len:102 (+) Transcript_24278:1013-1318(+)